VAELIGDGNKMFGKGKQTFSTRVNSRAKLHSGPLTSIADGVHAILEGTFEVGFFAYELHCDTTAESSMHSSSAET